MGAGNLSVINTPGLNNRSFISSASRSMRPQKTFARRGNQWFHLKSLADSQIYVEMMHSCQSSSPPSTSSSPSSISSIYVNIQDDIYSDSCTNFESFNAFDDILSNLHTSELTDPRIKHILRKLYSKVNSTTTEEKVQKEYIDTQIELFTGSHRDRNSAQLSNSSSSSSSNMKQPVASKFHSKSITLVASKNKLNVVAALPTIESLQITNILEQSPPEHVNIDDWGFNVFELRTQEERYTITWNILQRSEFFETAAIPEEVYANFIKELQKNYDVKGNEFHNFNHGISGTTKQARIHTY